MRIVTQNPTFVDLNMLFGVNVYPEIILDEDVIRASIYHILITPVGSRLFRPDYGSRLQQLLFEPLDSVDEEDIEVFLLQAIEKWEPRILINRANIKATRIDGGFDIGLDYVIKQTDKTSNFSITALQ